MFLVDITTFMDWFVNLMLSGFTTTFNILDSIQFHNITLLDFILAFILIPTGVAIFIAISKVSTGAADAAYRVKDVRDWKNRQNGGV